ncbi:tetratricopeptide repeat protein [Streptomyces albus]|nr:tetratricopeptide repeat protein [Streptomyces albus]
MERAVAHRQTGAYAAALAHLDEAESRLAAADAGGTEPDPASLARLVRERGETRRHLGQFEEAVTLLGQALGRAPGDPGTLVSRASAHLSLGRPELAVADLDQALGRRPDHFWALLKRARAHDSLGDRDAALADLARAAELAQDPALVIGERAEIHRRAGSTPPPSPPSARPSPQTPAISGRTGAAPWPTTPSATPRPPSPTSATP